MDMRDYSLVVVFGAETLMEELEAKLRRELRAEAALLACRFPLPPPHDSWRLQASFGDGIDTVWHYQRLPNA